MPASYVHQSIAAHAADALQLFENELGTPRPTRRC